MTFELGLRELDYDWKERELLEERELASDFAEVMEVLREAEQLLKDSEE